MNRRWVEYTSSVKGLQSSWESHWCHRKETLTDAFLSLGNCHPHAELTLILALWGPQRGRAVPVCQAVNQGVSGELLVTGSLPQRQNMVKSELTFKPWSFESFWEMQTLALDLWSQKLDSDKPSSGPEFLRGWEAHSSLRRPRDKATFPGHLDSLWGTLRSLWIRFNLSKALNMEKPWSQIRKFHNNQMSNI